MNYHQWKWQRRCNHLDFDVEAWYPILKNHTFYTEFVPITPAIANAFINFYQTRYNSKVLFDSDDLKAIRLVEDHLKHQVFDSKTSRFRASGAFVRLSSRSPKDGDPLDTQLLIQSYSQAIALLRSTYPDEYVSIDGKANLEMIAHSRAQFECLKVTSAHEALNLILSSERVFTDLIEAVDCQEIQNDWKTNIIVRQWSPLLDPSMEFRCFVYRSKLTAISQYNHYCRFEQFQNENFVQRIKTIIVDYWQKEIQELLDACGEVYLNYVIDIGVIEKGALSNLECIVIELNPFAPSTGASLFDWRTDIDQLKGERADIEIRVRSNYFPNIIEYTAYILQESMIQAGESHTVINRRDSYSHFLDKMQIKMSAVE